MSRAAGAAALACALAAGAAGGTAAAAEPWERIWFKVPVDEDGTVRTHLLMDIAHIICQGLGGRHFQSESSRLGPTIFNPQAEHGLERAVTAACAAEQEPAAKQ